MNKHNILSILLAVTVGALAFSQQNIAYDADKAFLTARDIAFSGDYTKARTQLASILNDYPDYVDAELLIAKTWSWDKEYDLARKHFEGMIIKEKQRADIWVAAILNEIYANKLPIALALANTALEYVIDDQIKALKTQLVSKIETTIGTSETLAKTGAETVKKSSMVGVATEIQVFDQVFAPTYQTTFTYTHKSAWGTLMPKVTLAQRFGENAQQYGIDAYPILSKTTYGYFTCDYSNSTTFPSYTLGAELYKNLPNAFEVSLGGRYMRFTEDAFTTLTASFGMYRGNYYFSARPFITPRGNRSIGLASNVLARKYLGDGGNFLGITLGYGMDGDVSQLIANGQLLAETLIYLQSQRLQLEYQITASKNKNTYKLHLGGLRQELAFEPGKFTLSVISGFSYGFKL